MADAFLGSLKIISFPFAPRGWAMCNGQVMPVNQNQALFALLGTQYGGNGQTVFNLPDLQGRVPLHRGQSTNPPGSSYTVGQTGGSNSVTLTQANMPLHTHLVNATSTVNNSGSSVGGHFAAGGTSYATASDGTVMNAGVVGQGPGTSAPIDIRQPFIAMNYVIALRGIFPPRDY